MNTNKNTVNSNELKNAIEDMLLEINTLSRTRSAMRAALDMLYDEVDTNSAAVVLLDTIEAAMRGSVDSLEKNIGAAEAAVFPVDDNSIQQRRGNVEKGLTA